MAGCRDDCSFPDLLIVIGFNEPDVGLAALQAAQALAIAETAYVMPVHDQF